ncbi:MAG: hypothetical protein KDD67_09410 [Ignavibacteriae bacterium]|nr:hypothetical protein [Ignavibacteriota bacterium]MCB9216439.1 hypothetical protein [Ignavibacteria bacterium]
MTHLEQVILELSEMYDIYMTFHEAQQKAGIPMDSPIPGMTREEFEELRRKYLEEMGSTEQSTK